MFTPMPTVMRPSLVTLLWRDGQNIRVREGGGGIAEANKVKKQVKFDV